MIRRRAWPGAVAMVLAALQLAGAAAAQQVADSAFTPAIGTPAFPAGTGPVVRVDEGHWNFHTMDGRFLAFARLLERDGWRVEPHRGRFTRASLSGARVLVIANALADTGEWVLPARPAFTGDEVKAVRDWVRAGGALLLIADHMPFPGQAASLAKAFGVEFLDGFALDASGRAGIAMFRRAHGTLPSHPVTDGRGPGDRVDSVATFTGQGFRLKARGAPVLPLDDRFAIYMPKRAWEFDADTRRIPGPGLVQGATLEVGRGRVAVFGEAAMFTAQLGGPARQPMGMNHPLAAQNSRLVLNVLRWLGEAPGADAGR
jgi:hypothetical protein